MERITEFDIIQNVCIGALSINRFVLEYFNKENKLHGPSIFLVLPILPIVFNKKSVEAIYTRNFEGGLFNAITEFRDFSVGLQQRMEDMTTLTFKSLDLAFKTNLVTYDKKENEIIPIRKTLPSQSFDEEIKKIFKASSRLGFWFSELTIEQICLHLNIKF